jgi:hypothetical protein
VGGHAQLVVHTWTSGVILENSLRCTVLMYDTGPEVFMHMQEGTRLQTWTPQDLLFILVNMEHSFPAIHLHIPQ